MILSVLCITFLMSLSAQEFPIAVGTYSQTYPEIAYNGENYYVAFVDKRTGTYYYGFYGRFVTPVGDVIAGETEIVPPHVAMSFMHHLTWGDDQYLFVWSRQRGPTEYLRDTYARRLNADGQPIGGSFMVSIGITVSTAFIRTAFDGENYLVIWQEGMPTQEAHIRGQFVSPTGSLIGQNFSIRPPDLPANTAQIYPDIVFDGTNYFVVWDDTRTGSRCVYGQFISPDGDFIGDNVIISNEPVDQMLVQTAFNGNYFFVIWADGRDNPNNKSVYGQLVDTAGNLVGEHIPISIVEANNERSWPAVGSNGNQFLVSWEQQIYRGQSAGFLTEEERIKSEAAGIDENSRRQIWYDVYGRLINADGSYGSDEFPICLELYHQDEPAVASDTQDFLVSWQDSRNQNQYYDIYGMIVEGEESSEYHPPRNLQAELVEINEIYLSWEEPLPSVHDVTAYWIYQNGELLEVIDDPLILEYQTTGRDNGVYSYFLTAIYEDDTESVVSNTVEVEVILLPPVDFSASAEEGEVLCSWLPPSVSRALSSYRLYRNGALLVETEETEYVDTEPESGMNSYFVTALYDGMYESISSDTVSVNITGIGGDDYLPSTFHLRQNIPNPFNPETKICYDLAEAARVRITVYDLKGRRVRVLTDDYRQAGEHHVLWDGRDESGREVSAGIYIYRMDTGTTRQERKMLLLK